MLNAIFIFGLIVLAAFVVAKVAEAAGLTDDALMPGTKPETSSPAHRSSVEFHDDMDFENNFPTMPEDLSMGLVRLVR